MIKKATIQFLIDLKKNNVKEWFDDNRKRYEQAKQNVLDTTQALIKSIGSYDEDVAILDAKECTFRINRDVRFSKNKSPYKNNLAMYFSKGGKKVPTAGYYIQIEPGSSFIAAGVYGPEPKKLSAIRQEIDYNFADWKKIVETKKFIQTFANGLSKDDILQRPPKGYAVDNPAIEYLKLKNFIATKSISDDELTDKNFVKKTADEFKVAKPLVNFLNNAE